ncbi:MAG: ATP-binding cassette domain-containing protein [Candidatus Woesearchaeota archaeon]
MDKNTDGTKDKVTENIISVKNLTKKFKAKQKEAGLKGSLKSIFKPKYKEIVAVNNISFEVNKGEIIGFIGPNGAGKSTTLKMLSGILFPDSGEINILGLSPQKERKKLAYHIGTVFGQKPQLWYHLPAIDTFNLFSKIYEIDQKTYEKRLKRLVKLFEVEDIIHQPVRKLSLGQRMRCELLASLLHNPKVIFLDEPTIGLDIIVKKTIRDLIRKLNKEENTTIILTSHDMEDVEKICKRTIIINQGKLIYDGLMKKIRENYLNKKRIIVILKEQISSLDISNTKLLYRGKFKHSLEVDTSKFPIGDVVAEIMSKYKIEDITVTDPPIEDIIEQIFKKEIS